MLLKSTDGGSSFRTVNQEENVAPRPFYYARLWVDPVDPDRVYNLHSIVTVSDDGGESFGTLIPWSKIHPDHHAFWIDPLDGNRLVDGNDGGLAISADRGRSWRFVENLPLAQFYHVQVDMEVPYHVLGGMQDNGSWRGPSEVWENGGIRNHHWQEVGFGDGFRHRCPTPAIRRSRLRDVASSGYLHPLGRWPRVSRKGIRPPAPAPTTNVEGEEVETELRFNWNAAHRDRPVRSERPSTSAVNSCTARRTAVTAGRAHQRRLDDQQAKSGRSSAEGVGWTVTRRDRRRELHDDLDDLAESGGTG